MADRDGTFSLCIRADASPHMGTGHVMRCIALAQAALNQGFQVCLTGRVQVPWVRDRLRREAFPFIELFGPISREERPENLFADLAGLPFSPAWIVLDGYHFGPDCQNALRDRGHRLLVIDDHAHLPAYSCDLLLNQNPGAELLAYRGDIGGIYTGGAYALLREEFIRQRAANGLRADSGDLRRVLLTLGGGDHSPFLSSIARPMLLSMPEDSILTYLPGATPPGAVQAALGCGSTRVRIAGATMNMPELLGQKDYAVSAAGSTCWELCCLGVPFCATAIAENQIGVARGLSCLGIPTFSPGEDVPFSPVSSKRLQTLVDGDGALRALARMRCRTFLLRPARKEDEMALLDLANMPEARKWSLSQAPIPLETHRIWFSQQLTAGFPLIYCMFVQDKKEMRGYVRFGPEDRGTAAISVFLHPEYQGRGMGSAAIAEGVRLFCRTSGVNKIIATVLQGNVASLRAFSRAGFSLLENRPDAISLSFTGG